METKIKELNSQKEAIKQEFEATAAKTQAIQNEIVILERYFALKAELSTSQEKLNQLRVDYQNVVTELNSLSIENDKVE